MLDAQREKAKINTIKLRDTVWAGKIRMCNDLNLKTMRYMHTQHIGDPNPENGISSSE